MAKAGGCLSSLASFVLKLAVGLFLLGCLGFTCAKFQENMRRVEAKRAVVAEPMALEVDTVVVKPIANQWRYFATIRNKDLQPFDGEVEIQLLSKIGKGHSERLRFNMASALVSEGQLFPSGQTAYFDNRTGPISFPRVDAGIIGFSWVARTKAGIVAKGQGSVELRE